MSTVYVVQSPEASTDQEPGTLTQEAYGREYRPSGRVTAVRHGLKSPNRLEAAAAAIPTAGSRPWQAQSHAVQSCHSAAPCMGRAGYVRVETFASHPQAAEN
jgi:hypothetical protein